MNRQADKLIGQHSPAAQAGSSVVVVADGNAGAGACIVVGIEVEVAVCAGVVMALQVSAHLVVAISQPFGKDAAFGIQEQACGLHGSARDHHDIGELLLHAAVRVKVSNAARTASVVGEDFLHLALGAQFAVAGVECNGDHGVLGAVFGIGFADKSYAPAAAHAGATAVIRHAVAGHRKVKRMQAEALCSRLKN